MEEKHIRSVGRPRADSQSAGGPARDAILLSAAELFAQQGYSGTSTREIAENVGIRQPSLFYHFKKKEDIFRAIIDEAAAGLLNFLPDFEKRAGLASAKLYELISFDVLYLMTEPYGIGQLLALPETRSGEFRQDVAVKRNRVINAYRKLIKRGIDEGEFHAGDINVITHTIFGMGEAIWSWYRPSRNKSATKIAEQIADLAIRSLLKKPGRLGAIRSAANNQR